MIEHLVWNLLHLGLNPHDIFVAVSKEIPEVGYIQILDVINNLQDVRKG